MCFYLCLQMVRGISDQFGDIQMKKVMGILTAMFIVALIVTPATATTIVSASSIISEPPTIGGYEFDDTINQTMSTTPLTCSITCDPTFHPGDQRSIRREGMAKPRPGPSLRGHRSRGKPARHPLLTRRSSSLGDCRLHRVPRGHCVARSWCRTSLPKLQRAASA